MVEKKKKQMNIMIITKRDCQNKHETNIKNYLMKEIHKKRICKKEIWQYAQKTERISKKLL